MVTAIDTNILIDHLSENPSFTPASVRALREARLAGPIVISDIVYAELCVSFAFRSDCDAFLFSLSITVEALNADSSFRASRNWIGYLKSGGEKVRILPDFLIAGHAAYQADRLLTRDAGFDRKHFDSLVIHKP